MHRGIALNDLTKKAKTLLEGECWHEIVRFGESIAMCKHCAQFRFDMKWYCENSPDHLCHYESEWNIGKKKYCVESVNGEKIYLENYSKEQHKYENSDHCIFCGQPEERK